MICCCYPPKFLFQSTLSARRATYCANYGLLPFLFQSTLSARRATLNEGFRRSCSKFQSTLSARRATYCANYGLLPFLFQSTLSARRATLNEGFRRSCSKFQSTLSARRATSAAVAQKTHLRHFNPRSPRGERLKNTFRFKLDRGISIHALREESDSSCFIVS